MFRSPRERFLLALPCMQWEWIVEWVVEEEEVEAVALDQVVNPTGFVEILTVEIRILVGVRNATDARHQEMDHLILRMDKMKGNSLECVEDFVAAQEEADREGVVEETVAAHLCLRETIQEALVATQAEEGFVVA